MLEVRNLTGQRDELRLFENLSFTVQAGQLLYIRGKNGAGKTTLIRILCGLIPPSQGEILWNGVAIKEDTTQFRQTMVYVGHENGIKGDLTALENLNFFRNIHQSSTSLSAIDSLEQLGIVKLAQIPCRLLSAGQKRRVSLSKLPGSAAKLWLLDEPLTALDVSGQQTIVELIRTHLAKDGICVVTSHQDLDWGAINLNEIHLKDA